MLTGGEFEGACKKKYAAVFCLVVVLLKVVVNTFKSCRFGDTKC